MNNEPTYQELENQIAELKKQKEELIVELNFFKEKAEKNEQKYQLISENTSDGILVIGADTQVQYVSPAYLKQIGYTEEEELSNNAETLYTIIHPEDRDALYAKIFQAIKDKKNELLYTYRVKHKFGHYIWHEDNAKFNFDSNGNHIDTYVICRNITERKHTEILLKKLQTAIESSKTSIVITDFDGNIEYANPFFTESTGYIKEEYLGKKTIFQESEWNDKTYFQNLWKTIKSGQSWEGEFCGRKKNGELYWENAIISPIRNSNDEITHFVAIKTDITLAKKINEELIAAKEKAEANDKLKTAFLHNISHEFRTPLNAIVGFSTLISNENSADKRNKFSEIISASSDKLVEIVTDMIEVSQLHTKQLVIKNFAYDFIQFINEFTKAYNSQIKRKNLVFITKINPCLETFNIIADKNKIHKILKHLVDNAIKFTIKGSIVIDILLTNEEIHFSVADTGIGISQDMQQIIFEPFRQIEVGMSRNYGGNGVGLAIVKGYVQLLNGKITLQSEFNIGTSFHVTIPIQTILHIDKLNKSAEKLTKKVETILIVEDEPSNLEYLLEILDKHCSNILYANNGQQAVDICRKNSKIEMVLMDIKMPIMDGYTATKMIKAFRPALPIIAQTAYAMDSDREKILENDFDDYICKPIQLSELFVTIDKYIN